MDAHDTPRNWTRRHWMAMAGLAVATGGAFAQSAPDTKAAGKPASHPAPIDVAVVLGSTNTLIDFAGPWEILSSSGRFNVYSVAASRDRVICDDGRSLDQRRPISGLTVLPDYTFENAPQPRIILAGGQGEPQTEAGKAVMDRKAAWIRRAFQQADLAASVCVGAYVLADSGVLDGQSATTNRNAYDDFEKSYPKIKVVRGVRFVESGKTATATGLTAGIDLALRITERFGGHELAQKLATYEEWEGKDWSV